MQVPAKLAAADIKADQGHTMHFSEEDLAALSKRFSVWYGFGDDLDPFVAAGGDKTSCGRLLELLDAALAAPTPDDLAKETKGDQHRRLHEWFIGSLIQAHAVPSRDSERLERHVKEMIQNTESALKKLLLWIDPQRYRAARNEALGGVLTALMQTGAMPSSYDVKDLRSPDDRDKQKRPHKWLPGEREKAEADYATEWLKRDAYAHAVRDLWRNRNKVHQSVTTGDHLWQAATVVLLGIVDKNHERLSHEPAVQAKLREADEYRKAMKANVPAAVESTKTIARRRPSLRRVFVAVLVVGLGLAAAATNPRVRAMHVPPAAGYPRALIKTISDDCATPWVILTTTSEANGSSYTWPVTRQAFRANRQFRIVAGDPIAPQQVHLAPYKYHPPVAYALVATCSDGATCNDVAAMYRAIVRSGAAPQLKCGKPETIDDSPIGVFQWSTDDRENLPSASDEPALCARINACQIAVDRNVEGDPFLECRRDSGRFKLSCATRDPCIEVLDCLARLDAVARSWGWGR